MSPRVKLIRHGLDDHGNDWWGFPIYAWGECPHPRGALRFDGRFSLPFWMYCRACGKAMIHPDHGFTDEEIAERKQSAKELADRLFKDWD